MRPIDADALVKALTDAYFYSETIEMREIKQIIDNTPTIELLIARGLNGVVIPVTRQPAESLLSNSEEITKAFKNGEFYKIGFDGGHKRGKEE